MLRPSTEKSVPLSITLHPKFNVANPSVDVEILGKDELLEQSDFISLHIPYTGQTVIGSREFGLMKKGSVLVNCARGRVVDEEAMQSALESGQLGAAGVDVFEVEPPVNMDFFTRDDVSLSPHIGAATSEAQARIGEELAQKIIAFFK